MPRSPGMRLPCRSPSGVHIGVVGSPMRRLAVLGLAILLAAACEDAAGPKDTPSLGRWLTADLGTPGSSFSVTAVLSNDLVEAGSPVTYTVDFGVGFRSIAEIDFFFTFGNDPLDPGECLDFANTDFPTGFGGGFCNFGTTPQPSRLLTISCPIAQCDPFRDGASAGQLVASTFPAGPASVRITSLTVTVLGEVAVRQVIQTLSGLVAGLVASGGLSAGNGNALQAKLQAAGELFDRGNGAAATNLIVAFIDQVNALGRAGRLSSSDGARLITLASQVIASINAP